VHYTVYLLECLQLQLFDSPLRAIILYALVYAQEPMWKGKSSVRQALPAQHSYLLGERPKRGSPGTGIWSPIVAFASISQSATDCPLEQADRGLRLMDTKTERVMKVFIGPGGRPDRVALG
jgi:hypothetical protein